MSARAEEGEDSWEQSTPLYECQSVYIELPGESGSRRILDDVTFDVHKGDFVSLVGPSGVGKTTLLRAFGGLTPSNSGSTVKFDGAIVTEPPRGAVMVFQDYSASLLPWRTVERNVALGIEKELGRGECSARVGEALELVGLLERAKDYPWRLSGGMQQRVQLARALAMRPQVLLMDEPFGALDAMTKTGLQDQLQTIHQETGCTIMFITHDIDEAVYLSDRVIVLGGIPGKIVHVADVNLPRPRTQTDTKESGEYLRLRHGVYEALYA